MKNKLMKQVKNSIFEVMETMFFLTLEEFNRSSPLKPDHSPPEMKTAAASFSGNFSGSIFLSIPPSLLNTMTENFMGQDISTLSEAHVDGTLKEALNMIAGNALTRVDNTSYMGLGIPEILSDPGQDNTDASVTLHTLDDILIARVKLNSLGDPNG